MSYAIKAALGKGLSATTVCRFGNPDGTGGPRTQNHNPSYELDALTICATVPYKMGPFLSLTVFVTDSKNETNIEGGGYQPPWSNRRNSNSRPLAPRASVLPAELLLDNKR